MRKTAMLLLCIDAALVVAIVVAVICRTETRRTPDDVIRHLLNDENITTEDWALLKRIALAEPALTWSSMEGDWLYQKRDFDEWSRGKGLVQESWLAIEEWLGNDGEPSSIDVVATNAQTGAQYHITGTRSSNGASCQIKFVGNAKSK